MEEAYLASDPAALLLLLGLGFAFGLAWVMSGVVNTRRAENDEASPRVRQIRVPPVPPRFDTPDRRDAPIGRYMDCTIYDSVSIGGIEYRYDRVLAPGAVWRSDRGERCIAPGLVYVTR